MSSGKLTHIQCKNAKYNPDGEGNYLSDGGGLNLVIKKGDKKYWQLSYRFHGKQKKTSFGVFPRVSLQEARQKREAAKKMLEEGKNPNEEKKIAKLEKIVEYENNFENIAREWHEHQSHAWQPRHAERIMIRLENNVFPLIGRRPIKAITPPEILAVIRKIEERGANDMAYRIKQFCSQIYRYAVATGRAERDITADLRGALVRKKTKNLARLR